MRTKIVTIKTLNSKEKVINEIYSILENTYKNIEGGLNFKDKNDLLNNTADWKVILLNNKIIGVLIYKLKNGLKMVACAIKDTYKNIAKKMLVKVFKNNFTKTWMEVSEGLERFILKISTAKDFVVNNRFAKEILNKDITLCDDNNHYFRNINGVIKAKIIVGTPNMVENN